NLKEWHQPLAAAAKSALPAALVSRCMINNQVLFWNIEIKMLPLCRQKPWHQKNQTVKPNIYCRYD
ncbi:MAG: hypothetical protein J1E77_01030, partial [Prevotella sp.]|nr:hypothetical protein [Prevotella sp.]